MQSYLNQRFVTILHQISLLPIFSLFFFVLVSFFSKFVRSFLQKQQYYYRYITIFSEQYQSASVFTVEKGELSEESVDLRTLRAIRVLRPLKLVSGIPSKKQQVVVVVLVFVCFHVSMYQCLQTKMYLS